MIPVSFHVKGPVCARDVAAWVFERVRLAIEEVDKGFRALETEG
jgi:hypothetical protein